MKKKLIQIFMLLVATISVGSFVSCKDTNEDLYNELRTQAISENASLKDALNTRIGELEAKIAALEAWKATVEATFVSCTCDEDAMNTLITGLQTQIDAINGTIATLAKASDVYTKPEVDAKIAALQTLIDGINSTIANLASASDLTAHIAKSDAAFQKITETIAALQLELEKARCNCDQSKFTEALETLSALEVRMARAEADIQTALENAAAAQVTAARAVEIANATTATAEKALEEATKAAEAAATATTDAAVAKTIAEQAAAAATAAAEAANAANQLALQASLLAEGNKEAIATLRTDLQNNTKELRDAITKNSDAITQVKADLAGQIEKIAANAEKIATNAANIQKNAEDIAELKKDLATVQTKLSLMGDDVDRALADAAAAAAKADANYALIRDLEVRVALNEAAIATLKESVNTLLNDVKELGNQVTENKTKIEALENSLKTTNENVSKLSDNYNELSKNVTRLEEELKQVKDECAKILSDAKEYVDAQILIMKNAILAEIASNYYDKGEIDGKFATKEELANKILELYSEFAPDIATLLEKAAKNEDAINKINEDLKKINEAISTFATREELNGGLQELYNILMEYIKANAGGMTQTEIQSYVERILQGQIEDALKDVLTDPDGLLSTLTDQIITNIFEGDTYNYLQKDELEDLIDQMITDQIDPDKFNQALTDLTELAGRVLALEEGTVKIADYEVDKTALWKAINDNYSTLDTKIDNLETAVDTEIGKLNSAITTINGKLDTMQGEINTLKSGLETAKGRLDAVEGRVDILEGQVDDIQKYLAEQVTGITIQGTHNPMFGSFSIPANIQSNFLIAYYGRPANKVEFPTTDDVMYVRKNEVLTDDDWAMINGDDIVFTQKANKVLMNEYEINDNAGTTVRAASAGKVYVTVNPTTANVDGLQLNIVNTQDKESLINLSPLRKSYATLEFGFSRANNGFYEADAYVNIADLDNVDRPFDEQAIKDLAKVAKNELKDIISGSMAAGNTGLDVLAVKVYDVVRSLRIDQSGLKCPFKAADGSDQAIYSQYNLAATAVKPVTLGFGLDFNYKTAPGYERVEKMLATIYDKLNGVVVSFNNNKEINNLFRDLDGLNIKHVTLNELSDSYLAKFVIEIETSFTIDDVRYDLVLPVDVWVPVKYAEDLTTSATGAPLTIDAANAVDLSYFDDNIASNVKDALFNKIKTQVTKPTVVIKNDDSGNLTSALVVPVNDQSGKVQGFTQFPLETPVALVSGEIQFDGTGIALVSGSSLVTTGYTQSVNIDQLNYSFVFKGKTFEYYKKVDLSDAIKDLWYNQVGEAIGDVNDILDQLNNLIADALKLRDLITRYEGKYTNAVENYFGVEGKLHGYLDKINNVIVNFVNGINWQLGPFIVAEDSKGFKVMSTVKGATVMSKNNLRIYPTSKNLEILVPFARKHVAVTNVFKGSASAQGGDADCLAKLKAANTGDLNKVIDGTQRMIEVTGVESGYTYEFAYSVLDFNGNISTRKTYIKIK